jgi:hypothetical protein
MLSIELAMEEEDATEVTELLLEHAQSMRMLEAMIRGILRMGSDLTPREHEKTTAALRSPL